MIKIKKEGRVTGNGNVERMTSKRGGRRKTEKSVCVDTDSKVAPLHNNLMYTITHICTIIITTT